MTTTTLQRAEALLSEMTLTEKAQLLQWVVSDLGQVFPGIEKTPGICGGDARIAGSRITIWLLVSFRQLGMNDEQMLNEYPTLRAIDLENAWNYYRANKEEIEAQIRENERLSRRMQ